MAVSTTANVMTAGGLSELVSREAIRQYQDQRFFAQFGREESLPAGHNTFQFTTVDSMSGSVAALTEGTVPSEVAFNLTGVDVSITGYGGYTKLSDRLLKASPINAFSEAGFELGNDLARKIDQAYQDVVDAGTSVTYVGQSSRAAITASDSITASEIANAVRILEGNNAPKFGDSYICVMHPDVFFDLQQETGTGTYIDLNKYNESTIGKLMTGQGAIKGELFGATIIVSSNVQFYADGGASNVDAYPTYVFGRNAFGHVTSGGAEVLINGLGSAGSSDPLNQIATVGVKQYM